MELSKQCVSLELAKKMKELGFKQEIEHGSFAYCSCHNDLHLIHEDNDEGNLCGEDYSHRFKEVEEWIKAYTVAELGEMLPDQVDDRDDRYGVDSLEIKFGYNVIKENGYSVYLENMDYEILKSFIEKTEADARAKMLCYLKENNLI